MKLFGSKRRSNNQVVVIPPSPIKEKVQIINGNVDVKPQFHPSANFGSKEETFFDSQAWLDSDCESDFMSVNGEFTPSRGNTPVHHNFPGGTSPVKGGAPSSHPPPSPIKKKKRLSELFSESIRENYNRDNEEDDDEPANEKKAVGSVEGDGGMKPKRERWVDIVQVQGCLPRVLSSCRPVTTHQTEVRRT